MKCHGQSLPGTAAVKQGPFPDVTEISQVLLSPMMWVSRLIYPHSHSPFQAAQSDTSRSNPVLMSTHASPLMSIEEKSNLVSVRGTTVWLNLMILRVFSNLKDSMKWFYDSQCNRLGYKLPCWAVESQPAVQVLRLALRSPKPWLCKVRETGVPTGGRSTEEGWAPFPLTGWALLFLSSKELFGKNTGKQKSPTSCRVGVEMDVKRVMD